MSADYNKLLAAFDYDLAYQYHSIEVTSPTLDTARRLAQAHPLRAYDAVQLATAWLINLSLTQADKAPVLFISADERLNTIAKAEGLPVENPNDHP